MERNRSWYPVGCFPRECAFSSARTHSLQFPKRYCATPNVCQQSGEAGICRSGEFGQFQRTLRITQFRVGGCRQEPREAVVDVCQLFPAWRIFRNLCDQTLEKFECPRVMLSRFTIDNTHAFRLQIGPSAFREFIPRQLGLPHGNHRTADSEHEERRGQQRSKNCLTRVAADTSDESA